MRFATLAINGSRIAAVADDSGDWFSLTELLGIDRPADLGELIAEGIDLERLRRGLTGEGEKPSLPVAAGEEVFAAPYVRTRKIWGIGLNYAEHAADLSESRPEQPASFIKGDHTIVGPREDILLPPESERVTAEAELGVVIGRECYRLRIDEDPFDYVLGFVPILDQTAEDILQLNPRYLTRAKNFPTFFSFGPVIVTIDEALRDRTVEAIEVATMRNGEVLRKNLVSAMLFGPRELIRFHAEMMPLFPGDILSTGTPGAVPLEHGDTAEARIDGFPPLANPVVRLSG